MRVIGRLILGFHEWEPGEFEERKYRHLPKINWFGGKETQVTETKIT